MMNYAKPNQKLGFDRYNREFAITVIIIIEFDCILPPSEKYKPTNVSTKKSDRLEPKKSAGTVVLC